MLDCGANVSFIITPKCRTLGITDYIQPAIQLTLQADGQTRLHVRVEINMILIRSDTGIQVQ